MSGYDDRCGPYPMRLQVLPGSEAEVLHYRASKQYNDESIEREALAPGVTASPVEDLVFRGGRATCPSEGRGRSPARLVWNLPIMNSRPMTVGACHAQAHGQPLKEPLVAEPRRQTEATRLQGAAAITIEAQKSGA